GAVRAVVAAAVAAGGRLDGLVHAAGVAGGGLVHQVELTEWDRVVGVNLTGTFLTAKHAVTQMLTQDPVDGERGSLVTIASIEGLEGTAGGSAYNASKGGVVLLTKNLALDYGPSSIRANVICPGFIDTPMLQSVMGSEGMAAVRERYQSEHKLGRFGRADEIAAATLFLASDESSFVTGHSLVVDGGYTAGTRTELATLLGLG
ncbi:MAG TPA: SDR family oxidoreductase, partial [Acidimicrobiales bacterium]|nr:SDR family oxidoreductase [Acidimicrobiales bacterium]